MKVPSALFPASLGALLLAGCASAPREQFTDTQAAIRAAEEVGAPKHPDASLHLLLAREQLEEAKAFMADEEYKTAENILERAELDAELAIALARKEDVREDAHNAWMEVQSLRRQFE